MSGTQWGHSIVPQSQLLNCDEAPIRTPHPHFYITYHRTRDPWKTIRPNPSRGPLSPSGACPAWGPIRTCISLEWMGVGKAVSRDYLLTAETSGGGAGLLVRHHRAHPKGRCSPWCLSLPLCLLDPCGQGNPEEGKYEGQV